MDVDRWSEEPGGRVGCGGGACAVRVPVGNGISLWQVRYGGDDCFGECGLSLCYRGDRAAAGRNPVLEALSRQGTRAASDCVGHRCSAAVSDSVQGAGAYYGVARVVDCWGAANS